MRVLPLIVLVPLAVGACTVHQGRDYERAPAQGSTLGQPGGPMQPQLGSPVGASND